MDILQFLQKDYTRTIYCRKYPASFKHKMVHTYLGYSTQIQRSLTFNDQQKVALAWRVSDMDPLIDGLLFYSGLFKKTFRSPNTAGDNNKHSAKPHLA